MSRPEHRGGFEVDYLWHGMPGHPIHPPLTDVTIGTYTFALVAATVLVSGAAVAGCTSERKADLDRPAATVAPEEARDSAATELVDRLEAALVDGSVDGVPASDEPARTELEAAAAQRAGGVVHEAVADG